MSSISRSSSKFDLHLSPNSAASNQSHSPLNDTESEQESIYDESITSLSLINNLSTLDSRASVGRKKNEFTLILENFFTKNSKNPKKEFFNTFVIRSIKRFFRNAAMNRMPIRTCLAIDLQKKIHAKCWKTTLEMYRKCPVYYEKISLTTNAPLTDGKAKRREGAAGKQAKSHNNDFCKNFFSDKRMQKAFFVLMDLLFADSDPNQLKEKFKFTCCVHEVHIDFCYENWNTLKMYLYCRFLEDLDLVVDDGLSKYWRRVVRIETLVGENQEFDGPLHDALDRYLSS